MAIPAIGFGEPAAATAGFAFIEKRNPNLQGIAEKKKQKKALKTILKKAKEKKLESFLIEENKKKLEEIYKHFEVSEK